jgi:hypothetical protein
MRRRLVAILGVLGVALLVPFSAVLADSLPPAGSYSYFSLDSNDCTADFEFVCVRSSVGLTVSDGVATTLCLQLEINTFNGGQVYLGHGCTLPGGALTFSNKFIVGIASTSFDMYDNGDAFLSTVTISSTGDISGQIVRDQTKAPWPGPCGGTWTGRSQMVDVVGTITIDGVGHPDTGTSMNLDAKVRSRC